MLRSDTRSNVPQLCRQECLTSACHSEIHVLTQEDEEDLEISENLALHQSRIG